MISLRTGGEGWIPVSTYLQESLSFVITECRKWYPEPSNRDTNNIGNSQCYRESLQRIVSKLDNDQGHSSLTNAATMSQSSALEPENFCFRRRCKRKTTAILASAIKTALVAIIARDAEVVMMENNETSFQRREGEKRIGLKSVWKNEWMTRASERYTIYGVARWHSRRHGFSKACRREGDGAAPLRRS